jgi:hypothetical protein
MCGVVDCPVGGICPGSVDKSTGLPTIPYAQQEFYGLEAFGDIVFTECLPPESCFGGPDRNRLCSVGYVVCLIAVSYDMM